MMGRMPVENEGDALPSGHGKFGNSVEVLPVKWYGGSQEQGVWTSHSKDAAGDLTNPGNDRAIIEPDHQVHGNFDFPTDTFHDSHNINRLGAKRHEVDEPH
jgi:hypothetical protein